MFDPSSMMDIPSWYGAILGCIIIIWRFFNVMYRFVMFLKHCTAFFRLFILKHLLYPHLYRRLPLVGTGTRFEILAGFIYLAANILCVILPSSADVGIRSASMSLINMIPLLCGPRLLLITELLGISRRTHIGFHKLFGRTAIAQVIVHSIFSALNNQPFQWSNTNTSGVMASSALGLLLVFSVELVRRFLYEWFLRSHFILSTIALVAIWRHVGSKKQLASISLQIGIYLWTGVFLIHWVLFAFRNIVIGRPFAKAQVEEVSNALRVTVTIPRAWEVKAGQYIFLTIPRASIFSGVQSHPFMIAWWERDIKGLKVYLLVKRRRGFTEDLGRRIGKTSLAFIDGPYGQKHDFGDYGTVVMFATDIGIAGHIPFIKDLLRGHNSSEIRTRRIVVVWQMEHEWKFPFSATPQKIANFTLDYEDWVTEWMQAALNDDKGMILQITLYAIRKSTTVNAKRGGDIEYGRRLNKIFDPADIDSILMGEFENRMGRMMVSVCAKNSMADKVRKILHRNMDRDVRLVELDFEPSIRHSRIRPPTEMEFSCRGIV